ncbi:MAG: lamin tail domain-containing protein [Candidatus Viridilinea halotolerans]|uniref:Lamin tail domain-containing protein n=1 Tax=Candidatus Viridilinea halotolerans TaxID=2491704 RepID=A0A426U496_9CHLR|nr:MAG: lamin tail domain-containing protein [Candidatus Viridilinea halotolerans]
MRTPSPTRTPTNSPVPTANFPVGSLLLSEILPAPREQYNNEWVELYNPGETSIALEGWRLNDANDSGGIVLEGRIAPGEYLVVELPRAILNNSGDTVRLFGPDGALVDSYSYGPSAADQSFTRDLTSGQWRNDIPPSPGSPGPIVQQSDAQHATPTAASPILVIPGTTPNTPTPTHASDSGLAAPAHEPTYAQPPGNSYHFASPTPAPPSDHYVEPQELPPLPNAAAPPTPGFPWLPLSGVALIVAAGLLLVRPPAPPPTDWEKDEEDEEEGEEEEEEDVSLPVAKPAETGR